MEELYCRRCKKKVEAKNQTITEKEIQGKKSNYKVSITKGECINCGKIAKNIRKIKLEKKQKPKEKPREEQKPEEEQREEQKENVLF